ncbi:hypothetical protein C173_11555 [Paenibacillus sp. FSL R7-277]|nr:hypothetical protein C173_11555 [Paenibacillus sp. FSL R7-277]
MRACPWGQALVFFKDIYELRLSVRKCPPNEARAECRRKTDHIVLGGDAWEEYGRKTDHIGHGVVAWAEYGRKTDHIGHCGGAWAKCGRKTEHNRRVEDARATRKANYEVSASFTRRVNLFYTEQCNK